MAKTSTHPDIVKNLVLIGGRGCGKSSVAKRLMRRNRNFMLFSLDALIRYEASAATIPDFVAAQGWPAFRDLEYEVVRKVSAFESGALLDCGGGVVVDLDEAGDELYSERKVTALRRNSLVVYLQRDPAYLLDRIGADPNRPELSESRSFLEVMERRDPWYRQAADHVLACGESSKSELVDAVLDWFYASQHER